MCSPTLQWVGAPEPCTSNYNEGDGGGDKKAHTSCHALVGRETMAHTLKSHTSSTYKLWNDMYYHPRPLKTKFRVWESCPE
jgi:hypothetical protein